MSDAVVHVSAASKKYCRTLKHTMLYGVTDLASIFFGFKQNCDRLRDGEFWALDDISFDLTAGSTIGLIGPNGSGKSTLLKMLNGIIMPDRGRIEVKGRVGALIEVGAGFHPMLTGLENIYVNGTILGLSKKVIDRKLDEIIDFADIGDFINSPVKYYSSGMYVKLGFAVAIHAVPDILLIDEVLSVGDASFQKKCFNKILDLKKNGTSIIFVSHSVSAVERLCEQCLFLKQGKQMFIGDTMEAVQRYFNESSIDHIGNASKGQTIGVGDVVIFNVYVFQEDGDRDNANIEFNKNILIEFEYRFTRKEGDNNQIRIGIRTFEGHDVQKIIFQEVPFSGKGIYGNEKIIPLKKEGKVQVKVLNPKLFPQSFILDIAVSPLDKEVHIGGISNAAIFNIIPPRNEKRYFEYGSMSVTEFDYEVSICV